MKRKRSKYRIDDDQEDPVPSWLEKLDKSGKHKPRQDDQLGPPRKGEFRLAPHHVIVLSGYGRALIKGDPTNRRGFQVLCTPGGLPVARLHGDLKPGEVSWVLR